jgi:hypothetical protein
VAAWIVQREILTWEARPFDFALVRSAEEIKAGPYIDQRGREVACEGIVEMPDHYLACGPEALRQLEAEDLKFLESARRGMEADVVISLAGPLAERRYRHVSWFDELVTFGTGDRRAAERKAKDFATDQDDLRRIIDPLEKRASKIVRDYWEEILVFADALIRQGRVEYEEAVPIFERALSRGA